MKRVFIIHGWGGNPHELLHVLLKERFSEAGFEVIAHQMPHTDKPEIEEWVSYLQKLIANPNKNTYFVGHSVGCQAIMHYLETFPENTRVGKCIFIAGWFNLDNMEDEEEEMIARPWIEHPINFSKIKEIAEEILVYLSSNEPYGYIEENTQMFKEKLGAHITIEKDMGHFTDDEGHIKLSRFADKIQKALKMMKYKK